MGKSNWPGIGVVFNSTDYTEAIKKCKHYLTSSTMELTFVGKISSINQANEKPKAFETWTATNIDQQQAMLIELANEVWKSSLIENVHGH